MITSKEISDYGSALLVFVSGAATGHHAALGMNTVQWAGAITAVLGSVTVAVAVRLWPAPEKTGARAKQD